MRIPDQTQYYIDGNILRKLRACHFRRAQFKTLFPKGRVFLTLENYTRAVRAGLSPDWLEYKLFDAFHEESDSAWFRVSGIYSKITWVSETASDATIAESYRRLVRAVHRLATLRARLSPPTPRA